MNYDLSGRSERQMIDDWVADNYEYQDEEKIDLPERDTDTDLEWGRI